MTCSALTGDGIADIWHAVGEFARIMGDSGDLTRHRANQAKSWMWKEIREMLMAQFEQHPKVAAHIEQMERAVLQGEIAPTAAAMKLVALFHQ